MTYEIKNHTIKITVQTREQETIPDEPIICLQDLQSGFFWADAPCIGRLEICLSGRSCYTERFQTESVTLEPGDCPMALVIRFIPIWNGIDADCCRVVYRLTLPGQGSWFEESIAFENHSAHKAGILQTCMHLRKTASTGQMAWMAIPFHSHDTRPDRANLTLGREFYAVSEGALLLSGDGGLAIARKPSDSRPRKIAVRSDAGAVTFGTAAGCMGGVEIACAEPGAACSLGVTAYLLFRGTMEKGFLAYRGYMAKNGVAAPQDYHPPVNYCIYYECGEYYQYQTLIQEIKHAEALGCTMLYLDQGWEDYAGSGVWDSVRLGGLEDFIHTAARCGLEVGLLIKLHGRAFNWDPSITRKDGEGNILSGDHWGIGNLVGICPSSEEWKRLKTQRLQELAGAGVKFFSFDFNDYQTETACRDPRHPHGIPMSEWEHVVHVADQQRMVKQACPGVTIEAHDWKSAGEYIYPIYMFQNGHHERWGFEYMWRPYEDFISGRLHNLFYYNLAYEAPLYLHMDLTSDNESGAVFWYIASTVRHFGVGNFGALDEKRKRFYVELMKIYRAYQTYFANGVFSGADPSAHFHTIPSNGTVALLFNDHAAPETVCAELDLEYLGINKNALEIQTLYGDEGEIIYRNKPTIKQRLKAYGVSVMLIVNG